MGYHREVTVRRVHHLCRFCLCVLVKPRYSTFSTLEYYVLMCQEDRGEPGEETEEGKNEDRMRLSGSSSSANDSLVRTEQKCSIRPF